MSILYLIIYILAFSFGISAISGVVMFFIDMVRFGTPHKHFKTVSSVENYNKRLEEAEHITDAKPEPEPEPITFELDLEEMNI